MGDLWQLTWLDSATQASMLAWRMVESQGDQSTMHLADTADELDLLEAMLEESKPALPPEAKGLHYLLSTPFRYLSPSPTRFRRSHEPGVWYGADSARTACAEMAYWRMRFILDSAGLAGASTPSITKHSCIAARVTGRCVDLGRPPWLATRHAWMHPTDYSATQELADQTRNAGVQWIHYESVRERGGRCAAVLDPRALEGPQPQQTQDWSCSAGADTVIWRNRQLGLSYTFSR